MGKMSNMNPILATSSHSCGTQLETWKLWGKDHPKTVLEMMFYPIYGGSYNLNCSSGKLT